MNEDLIIDDGDQLEITLKYEDVADFEDQYLVDRNTTLDVYDREDDPVTGRQ